LKKNCWQYMECGREPGGKDATALGVCPAATEEKMDGVHGGVNAGRACWVIAGTFCNSELPGVFIDKHVSCAECEFYKLVRQQEYPGFISSAHLKEMLE